MRSPFPGMDPYLEDRWRDVHSSLVLYTRNQLQPQVRPKYRARVEERVVLDAPDEPSRSPDVKIATHHPDLPIPSTPPDASVAVAEPVRVLMPLPDEIDETFVQIIDSSGGKVVTVIEFLSPTNKRPGRDLDAFRQKQQEYLASDIAIVEIDLLRDGRRTLHVEPSHWPGAAGQRHYAACVSRPARPRRAELYGFDLRERLPAIRIPLRAGDPDVILDLQRLVDQAYADGGYDDTDYTRPPVPPLSADDEAWADGLLRAAGKRT